MGNEESQQEGVKSINLRTEVPTGDKRRSTGIDRANEASKQRPGWYRTQIRVPASEETRLQVCSEHDTISSIERKVDQLIRLISESLLERDPNSQDSRQVRGMKPRLQD